MTFNIDIVVVVGFLMVNLAVGLYFGRGIKTIKQYAIGDRNFNTTTIAATIIATWISGSFFTVSISQTYKEGVWFIPAAVGDILSLLIISYFLAPRMKKYLGTLSVAETMGVMYNKNIRIITALASLAQGIAMTALQIKIFATVFSHFLGFSAISATIISSTIVIIYTSWGGIKAVTFTDTIQFFTFGVFIPMFAVFIWKSFGNLEIMSSSFKNNELLDFSNLADYTNPKFFPNLFLFLWFAIPSLSSPTFQRVLMAKDTRQINKSFFVASIGYTFIMIFICIIGLLALSLNPFFNSDNIIFHIVDNYSFDGMRGITVIGIIAMIMSTADSWINISAVIFSHDLCKPLGIKIKNELLLSRIFSIIVGVGAIFMVLSTSSLFKLFSLQANFYMPIVTPPLMISILGFRTTAKVIFIGMLCGLLSVILWRIYFFDTGLDSVVPGMASNLIALLISHYLLGEPGGWIKNDNLKKKPFNQVLKKLPENIKEFNLLGFCNKNLPYSVKTYIHFFIAVFLTMITTLSIDESLYQEHLYLISLIQALVLGIGMLFLGYGILLEGLKEKFLGIIWYVSIFTSLIVISSFLVLLSKFSHASLIILTIHLTLVSLLLGWRTAIFMIILGLWLSFSMYELFIGEVIAGEIYDFKLKMFYILFMVGGFAATFLKIKQDEATETKAKVTILEKEKDYFQREFQNLAAGIDYFDNLLKTKEAENFQRTKYLKDKINLMSIEIEKLQDMKDKFLRNLPHESNTPLTGILSLSDALYSSYDSLDKAKIKDSIKSIVNSGDRLKSYIYNMINLSKLTTLSYELDKEQINLSDLVKERPYLYKKIFSDDAKQEFKFDVEDDIMVNADKYFITQAIDNLISNAVNYGKGKEITISLRKVVNQIEFKIIDQGVGIPENELYNIFNKFVTSLRTKIPADGRGIGLVLVQKIIEAHKGKIWAENNEKYNGGQGATFQFIMAIS